MAFNWNFKPRTLNGFNSAPVESLMPQAPGVIPTQMKGPGFSLDYNIQGLPQDTEDYQRAAYMDAYEADEAQKAQALQAQQIGQQKRIADIQNQIATLEKRIAENTAKLQNFAGNADQIAAIEARKINAADPTSIWRWKVDRDETRRIAKMEKEKTKSTQQNNVKYEIDNTLSSIIPRSDASSEEIQSNITKLYDLRTLAQKNEMPKSEIDKIDARIDSLRNPKSEVSEEAGENKDIFDEMTNLNTPEKKNARVEQLLARPEKTKPGDWAEVLKNPDGMNKDLVIKAKAEYGKALDRQKAENEAKEKENRLLKKGMNLSSEDLEFLKGRKGLKHHTDSYGNEWYTRG